MWEFFNDSVVSHRVSKRGLSLTESIKSVTGEAVVFRPRESSAKKFLLTLDAPRISSPKLISHNRKRADSRFESGLSAKDSQRSLNRQNYLLIPESALMKRRSMSDYIPPKTLDPPDSQFSPIHQLRDRSIKEWGLKSSSRGMQTTKPDNEEYNVDNRETPAFSVGNRILSSKIIASIEKERLSPKSKVSQRFVGLVLRPSQRSMASSYSDGIGAPRLKNPSLRSPEPYSEPDVSAARSRTVVSSKSNWTYKDYKGLTWDSIPQGAGQDSEPSGTHNAAESSEHEDEVLMENSQIHSKIAGTKTQKHPIQIFLKVNLDKPLQMKKQRRQYKIDTIVNPEELLAASPAFKNFVMTKELPQAKFTWGNGFATKRPSKIRLSLASVIPKTGL